MDILGRSGARAPDAATQARADAEIARGQPLEDAGDLAAAESAFRAAIAIAPGYPRAHLNLANVLQKQRRAKDAEAALREALRLDERYVPAWFNLGRLLVDQARWEEARGALERAVEGSPDLADAHVLLAMTHEGQGELARACDELTRALTLRPDLAGAWSNLGMLFLDRKMRAEAEAAFRRALETDPGVGAARALLAQMEIDRGELKEAAAGFREALALNPRDVNVWGAYLFSLNLRDDVDAQTVAREHLRFGEMMAKEVAPSPRPPLRSGRRPLRIGYVSGDFLDHPVTWFLQPVLDRHDPAEVRTYCYANGPEDARTAALREAAAQWRSIVRWPDERVAGQIAADEIDVLVDLAGHTPRNRLGVFARRAAPVQATWLGYLNTTGLATMDFRITDAFTDPPGMTEARYSEALARLPHSQWVYVPHTVGAEPREEPRKPGEPLVFGSFNQMAKLSDGCLDLWAPVLRALPESRLRIHAVPDATAAERVRVRLEARGIARSRVETRMRMHPREYLAALADVDIALDAYPYNGGTTTLDTYWMGVPLVALAGERGISRGSFSIASSAGFEELVAHTREHFLERNVALARDTAARRALRRTMRRRLEASPLMDPGQFTRDLEALYRRMVDA